MDSRGHVHRLLLACLFFFIFPSTLTGFESELVCSPCGVLELSPCCFEVLALACGLGHPCCLSKGGKSFLQTSPLLLGCSSLCMLSRDVACFVQSHLLCFHSLNCFFPWCGCAFASCIVCFCVLHYFFLGMDVLLLVARRLHTGLVYIMI